MILDGPQLLFSPRSHARIVVVLAGDLVDRVAHVAGVQAEILLGFPSRDLRPLDDDLSQGPVQQLGVVEVGAADGD